MMTRVQWWVAEQQQQQQQQLDVLLQHIMSARVSPTLSAQAYAALLQALHDATSLQYFTIMTSTKFKTSKH
jgi:hypothetical protein